METAKETAKAAGKMTKTSLHKLSTIAKENNVKERLTSYSTRLGDRLKQGYENTTKRRADDDINVLRYSGAAALGVAVSAALPGLLVAGAAGVATYKTVQAKSEDLRSVALNKYSEVTNRDAVEDEKKAKQFVGNTVNAAKEIANSFSQGFNEK